ncbi:hypothetical protein GALMADRAFT_1125092 [Galerina marginata CBS 339.88]|uniref:Uncharacterized protein n=1 Tax=Galerina marginata (strain CBS 339.88) TaxID=685588 RepID=A0A067TMZ2_GALM3|nr:hypothetical protein GALMADRAFT_1125092 [Galerina marginata CBS 339.88]
MMACESSLLTSTKAAVSYRYWNGNLVLKWKNDKTSLLLALVVRLPRSADPSFEPQPGACSYSSIVPARGQRGGKDVLRPDSTHSSSVPSASVQQLQEPRASPNPPAPAARHRSPDSQPSALPYPTPLLPPEHPAAKTKP